jgi:hypothetical protein
VGVAEQHASYKHVIGLGFRYKDSADAEVTENASGAGIIVVTAVGSMA